jgi:hypothetical protein
LEEISELFEQVVAEDFFFPSIVSAVEGLFGSKSETQNKDELLDLSALH